MNTSHSVVIELLQSAEKGDVLSQDQLLPLVYDELKRLANHHMKCESKAHTWQATELVHEAFIKLVGADIEWQNRKHFCAVASRAMRRILVDHARAKNAQKRRGGYVQITLVTDVPQQSMEIQDILALDQALIKLSEIDPRKSQIIELIYFSGLSQEEIAELLDTSRSTIHREFKFCKAWLKRELGEHT